jgi:hypothetical protein
MKTDDLTGAALDWAVAKCEGVINGDDLDVGFVLEGAYLPSTDWEQGGPIIEREKIATAWHITRWVAWRGVIEHPGPTPLIAAMRCYVAAKLGDDIEIPEELK